jgi:hypothetical protein
VGPIGGEGDHSASSYDWVRDCVVMLGKPADDQYAYLVENGLPTTELLEQFFSVVPGFVPFLLARSRIREADAATLVGFEQFLIQTVCPKPWGDEREALDDPCWEMARQRAAQVLETLPPPYGESGA